MGGEAEGGERGRQSRGGSRGMLWEMEELVAAVGQVAVDRAMGRGEGKGAAGQEEVGEGVGVGGAGGLGEGARAAAAAAATAAAAAAMAAAGFVHSRALALPGRQQYQLQQQWGGGRGWGGPGGGGGGAGRQGRQLAPAAAHVLRHGLTLQSAYAAVDGCEPLFTTLHARYVGTVDFVWYSPGDAGRQGTAAGAREGRLGREGSQGGKEGEGQGVVEEEGKGASGCGFSLTPVRVLQPPDVMSYQYGMPCQGWPSDHVSMVVDFRLEARR